ncbi:MAG: S49 family peptidase [Dehalococcoidia bacterium]
MDKLRAVWRVIASWYVSGPLLAVLGIVLGALVFFYVFPGKPMIGVIDIPFTVINDDSSFVISSFMEYARRDNSIKAVFIRLNSPGGGAAASEHLYYETRKLREKKPVVIIMNDIVASGGYMMAMGANYTFAKPSSFVGNVGVILSFPGRFIARPPGEQVVPTGPFKLSGGDRRYFIGLTDQLKQAFAGIVFSERGDKLKISKEELLSAKIFPGVESVRVGMADELGGDTDAIEKAASLAGISNYGLVDINTEVFRIFNQTFKRIIEPLEGAGVTPLVAAGSTDLMALLRGGQGFSPGGQGLDPTAKPNLDTLRRYLLPSGLGESQAQVLPGFPLKVNGPNIYYLYVGPSQ